MDDLELVRRFITGDKPARDEFLNKYSRLVYSYIHSVLAAKGISPQDCCHDIFQEFFYYLINNDCAKLRTYKAKNKATMATWLRQVTVNFTLSYIRKLRPSLSLDEEASDGASIQDLLPADSGLSRGLLADTEKLKKLEDCIAGLSLNDKFFLELRLNRGLSFKELKAVFGFERGAFDMRWQRLVSRLRECFKTKGFMLDL